jgi:uncharacterized protein involved in high-affinity Fe2+ transport
MMQKAAAKRTPAQPDRERPGLQFGTLYLQRLAVTPKTLHLCIKSDL